MGIDSKVAAKLVIMHTEALTKDTKRVLQSLGESSLTRNVYLAGGSALALYYGHRLSVDLDWFGENFKVTDEFRRRLSQLGNLEVISQSEDTFHGRLDDVEVSFFRYPYNLLFPKDEYSRDVYLAAVEDIAAMKMEAIASRGSKKDFIDMYFLLKNIGLKELIELMPKKFGINYNVNHFLKALTYFSDAEKTAMPKMIKEAGWDEVKKYLNETVEKFVKNE